MNATISAHGPHTYLWWGKGGSSDMMGRRSTLILRFGDDEIEINGDDRDMVALVDALAALKKKGMT